MAPDDILSVEDAWALYLEERFGDSITDREKLAIARHYARLKPPGLKRSASCCGASGNAGAISCTAGTTRRTSAGAKTLSSALRRNLDSTCGEIPDDRVLLLKLRRSTR